MKRIHVMAFLVFMGWVLVGPGAVEAGFWGAHEFQTAPAAEPETGNVAHLWKLRLSGESLPDFFRNQLPPLVEAMRSSPGYRALELLQRESFGEVEVSVISRWGSEKALDAWLRSGKASPSQASGVAGSASLPHREGANERRSPPDGEASAKTGEQVAQHRRDLPLNGFWGK